MAQEWAAVALERSRRAVPRARVETVASGHDVLADARDQTIELVGGRLRPRVAAGS